MAGTNELTPALGLAAACRAMGLWRGAPGRHKARAHRVAFVGPSPVPRPVRPRSPLALSRVEQTLVLQALLSHELKLYLRQLTASEGRPTFWVHLDTTLRQPQLT